MLKDPLSSSWSSNQQEAVVAIVLDLVVTIVLVLVVFNPLVVSVCTRHSTKVIIYL